jgi:hypothetical protein
MQRLPDAGVSVILHQEGKPCDGDVKLVEQKGWKVVADRWGRVKQMVETNPRLVPVKG